ncbi:Transcriptional regulator, MarR family [Stenotrophomonas maltophilia D457]|nr:Transcriptional regulator, MarR family [Stenotrophomonas maltophilia D457]
MASRQGFHCPPFVGIAHVRWFVAGGRPTAEPLVAGSGLVAESKSRVWPGGWAARGTLQVRPCKLGRRIHAADTPAQPTRPASDSFLRGPPRNGRRRSKAPAGRALRLLMPL